MQTVQFQCGHCNKLMGVSGEFLGQQVRCPHCQQVVVAPLSAAPLPAPPEASSFSPDLIQTVLQPPIPLADPEDIFSPPDVTEDLFGQPDAPRIEMPPEIAPELALTATAPYLPSGTD